MYQSKKALREELNNKKDKLREKAKFEAELMTKNTALAEEIARLKKELGEVNEKLAKAEKERDEWREKYCGEAADNYAKDFKLEEYAGFETLVDLIPAYHKALEDLYTVRERMTIRVPVRRRKRQGGEKT